MRRLLHLRNIWMPQKYLELIWLRGISALKADTKRMHLGMLWWILEPLLFTGMFYLAFAGGLRGSGDKEFIFFLMSGMLPFKWTGSCISGSAGSLSSSQGIIGQMYLPKWIFPSIINLSMAIRFIFVVILLVGLMSYGGYGPSRTWLCLGYVILCQLFLNLGISYFVSSIVPLVPDLSHIVSLVVTGLMFTSGVFFDISSRPEHIQAILRLNPFVEVLDGYRSVLMQNEALTPFDMPYAWSAAAVFMLAGLLLLRLFDRYYPRVLQ